MIKIVQFLLFAFCVKTAFAQVNTPSLNCIPNGEGFPFSVQFFGNKVVATFKGFAHTTFFSNSYVAKNGDTWFVYENNQGLDVSITPFDKYVVIGTNRGGKYEAITSAFCK